MCSAKNTGTNAAKTTSKKIVQKTAEATGDLIGNKYQKNYFNKQSKT